MGKGVAVSGIKKIISQVSDPLVLQEYLPPPKKYDSPLSDRPPLTHAVVLVTQHGLAAVRVAVADVTGVAEPRPCWGQGATRPAAAAASLQRT